MKNFQKYFTKSAIIISLISLAIGFAGGFFFEKSHTPSFGDNRMNNGSAPTGNGGPRGQVRGASNNKSGSVTQTSNLKQTMGEITKIDDSSITIKTPDGGSKIILVSDSTVINKAAVGVKTDLIVGANVSITGDSNTDGSVTGKSININAQNDSPTVPIVN